ncbi:hypothetical protein DFAR_710024 [Desulfarculales bacterium]
MAMRLAGTLADPSLLDYLPVDEKYSVTKLAPPRAIIGKTLVDLDLHRNYGINVIAVRKLVPERMMVVLIPPDLVIKDSDVLILGVVAFVSMLGMGIIVSILPLYAQELGASTSMVCGPNFQLLFGLAGPGGALGGHLERPSGAQAFPGAETPGLCRAVGGSGLDGNPPGTGDQPHLPEDFRGPDPAGDHGSQHGRHRPEGQGLRLLQHLAAHGLRGAPRVGDAAYDLWSRLPRAGWGHVVSGLDKLLLPLADSFWGLFILVVLGGVGADLSLPALTAYPPLGAAIWGKA